MATAPNLFLLAQAALTLCVTGVHAQPVDEFYRNKPIRLIIGNPPGGDYDLGGRLLARHMRRHLPGTPNIVVQNMPGASAIAASSAWKRIRNFPELMRSACVLRNRL